MGVIRITFSSLPVLTCFEARELPEYKIIPLCYLIIW